MIAIGICTCDRPEQLGSLMRALAMLRVATIGEPVRVIVIDNSADATARPAFDRGSRSLPFACRFAHEPRPGLAFARNRALDVARAEGARLLAFIDDDEVPSPDWLAMLVEAVRETCASAVVGPVDPVFETLPPAWLPPAAYRAALEPKGRFVEDGYSGNCILDLAAITAAGHRFDERFNETGGEDTAFFRSLLAAGHRIAWAGRAVVHETVPRGRMKAGWLYSRWMRTGAIEAVIARSERPGPRSLLICLGKGALRLGAGTIRVGASLLVDAWHRPDRVVASLYTLCRGAGYLSGAFGKAPRRYGRATPQ